jgi:hypothetical protein
MRYHLNLAPALAIATAAMIPANAWAMPLASPLSADALVDAAPIVEQAAIARCLPPHRLQKICVSVPPPPGRPPTQCRFIWVCK